MKVLKSDKVAEFEKEASTLQSLSHGNIVQFYGIYKNGADTYIVTEFMDKGSVRDLVHDEQVDADLMLQMYIHFHSL